MIDPDDDSDIDPDSTPDLERDVEEREKASTPADRRRAQAIAGPTHLGADSDQGTECVPHPARAGIGPDVIARDPTLPEAVLCFWLVCCLALLVIRRCA